MMTFTEEEVSLCKQVAERHKKPIEYGDWMVINFSNLKERGVTLFDTKWAECPNRFPDASSVYDCSDDKYYKEYFPLWTISDCLEFLRERNFRYDLEDYHINPNDLIYVIMSGGKRNVNRLTFEGKTPLEACLKAVLEVLNAGTT